MRNPILDDEEFQREAERPAPERAKPRRIIEPTVLPNETDVAPASSDEIRIKARPSKDGRSCTFLLDRLLLERYSAWFLNPDSASGMSPLAEETFHLPGIESVQIHESTVQVTRNPFAREPWEETAKQIGACIRSYIKSGEDVVTEEFLKGLPEESAIRDKLDHVIATEVNPGIASHSGAIALERVEGNTVFIRMMGGCQGCAASTITLKQGIFEAFRDAVPQIGAILDVTEHAAGTNPYYKQLPMGMSADA